MGNSSPMFMIVFLPLILGFCMLFLPNKLRGLAKAITLLASLVAIYYAFGIFSSPPEPYSFSLIAVDNFTLSLDLAATKLGTFILLAVCGFGVLISIYSLKAIGTETKRACEYFAAILLTIGGSAGILLTQHLLVLLICWEIVTASLYLMIITGGRHSNFAGTKSFAMIGASDGALLLGIAMLWLQSGSFDIRVIHLATDAAVPVAAFILLLTAAVTKAGAMPLHTWMPTSGEHAPVSVMALLPAAIDKLLGIYLLVLIVKDLFLLTSTSLRLALTIIGAATIVIAVMVAMVQHNLKKLLSYHAISQVGYMVLGIASGTPVGLAGGVFHMLNHAIYKCCLFLCGGAVEQASGTSELEKLGGLGRKMPVTFTCCLIAALSISGIPPLNGFVSKWMVYQGIIQMGTAGTSGVVSSLWPLWLLSAMFGSALTLASFVKVIHSVFLNRQRDALTNVKEVSRIQLIPMIALAALCILLGLFYVTVLSGLIFPALGLDAVTINLSTWQAGLATGMLLIGALIGIVIWLFGTKAVRVRQVPTWYCGETIDNEKMVVPGTHFYRTVSEMRGLRQLYTAQEKGWFDLYDQGGRLGLAVTGFLRWMHGGILPMYLTWVMVGLLAILFVLCNIW